MLLRTPAWPLLGLAALSGLLAVFAARPRRKEIG
jgi:hypothetical protein